MTERLKILNKPRAGLTVLKGSLVVAGYFLALMALYRLGFTHVLIGVFIEMFTLPMLAFGMVLVVASVILAFRKGLSFRSFHLYSLLVLLAVLFMLFFEV